MEGRLPLRWSRRGPWGVYIALHRTWLVSAFLLGAIGALVGVLCFTVRHSACIHGDHLVSFTDSCVSLARSPIRGCFLDTCVACDWLDFLSSSSLFWDSVICADLWSRQPGPDASCDRHSVALVLSPSITVVLTPCYCGVLGDLHSALRLG